MIRLDDNYQIESDGQCYTLYKITRQGRNKRTGEEVGIKRPLGYYTTLQQAFIAYGDQLEKTALQAGVFTLTEAIEVVKESREELKRLLRTLLEST